MRAVDRLRLHGGIPPGIEQINVFGGVKIQSQSSGFQADEKQLHVGIVLKLFDGRLAVASAAVEINVGNLRRIEAAAHDGKQAGELRENQNLVIFFEHLIELGEQGVELGARLGAFLFIDQSRMAGRLAQAQQRFEHLNLELSGSIRGAVFQQARAVVIAQLVVELFVLGFEIAVNRLLGLFRQLGGDLAFRASENKRPQRFSKYDARVFVRIASGIGENRSAAEHSRD